MDMFPYPSGAGLHVGHPLGYLGTDVTSRFRRMDGDQSPYVTRAVSSVVAEGVLGALLVGLMILLFLGSWRSTVIIATSIPLAILGSIFLLALTGQTLNIMTLGGLALAVGILVDESTVEIENIHAKMEGTDSVALAASDD